MAFHPEKCVVIQVASKRRTISADYVLHNHHLDVVDSSKYLGVTISNNLKLDRHIDNITAKANRTLGFLKRNLRGCRTSARARAYEAIVRPTLEYAATYLGPSYHQTGYPDRESPTESSKIRYKELLGQTTR